MTARTLIAPTPEIAILEGMIIKLEAISPTTGAAITGVTSTHWAIYGEDLAASAGGSSSDDTVNGPFYLIASPESVA